MRWRYLILVGFFLLGFQGESIGIDVPSDKVSDPRPQKPEGRGLGGGSQTQGKEPPERPYTALVEKNIFSPDRKEFQLPTSPLLPPGGPIKKPTPRPQVILYGVTLAGHYQSATVIQQGRILRKGEREMLTLMIGEKIGEYRLTKILPDRIILEAEEDSFEVLLDDAMRPKTRTVVRTETKPATVTTAVPGPSPTEPTRPTPIPSPAPELPRPATPTERVGSSPMPTTVTPSAITPSPPPTPQPIPPASPPVYPPRRRIPLPPAPNPEHSPQSPTQGGP